MAVVGRRNADPRLPGSPCRRIGQRHSLAIRAETWPGAVSCPQPRSSCRSLNCRSRDLLVRSQSSTMRSTTALLVLLANLFALTTAHRDWWLKGLPKCWQSCFADTEDGCSSSSCKTNCVFQARRLGADCKSQASAIPPTTAPPTSPAPCLAP